MLKEPPSQKGNRRRTILTLQWVARALSTMSSLLITLPFVEMFCQFVYGEHGEHVQLHVLARSKWNWNWYELTPTLILNWNWFETTTPRMWKCNRNETEADEIELEPKMNYTLNRPQLNVATVKWTEAGTNANGLKLNLTALNWYWNWSWDWTGPELHWIALQ